LRLTTDFNKRIYDDNDDDDDAPCSSLDGVTACVVYIRPIRFEIRFERKKRFAVP